MVDIFAQLLPHRRKLRPEGVEFWTMPLWHGVPLPEKKPC